MCSFNKIKNEMILLPSKNDEPDWDFMEEFIKEIEEENKEKLTVLKDVKPVDDEIDISDWHEFRVGDLFNKVSVGFKEPKLFKKENHVSEIKNDEFNLPLVNAKDGNNGIMYYGRKEEWSYVNMSIDVISDGAISTGNIYPQIDDTSVLYNAYLIKFNEKYKKGERKECLIFIATVMEKSIKMKYGYENKATWSKVSKENIKLPSIYNQETNEYEPDWEYMEDFITNQQEKIKNQLKELKR